MALDPRSVRDHLVSVYQSIVDQAVHGPVTATGKLVPASAPGGIPQTAWNRARLGMCVLRAHIEGDLKHAQQLKGAFDFAQCSPNLLQTGEEPVNHFRPIGKRSTVPSIRADVVGLDIERTGTVF